MKILADLVLVYPNNEIHYSVIAKSNVEMRYLVHLMDHINTNNYLYDALNN